MVKTIIIIDDDLDDIEIMSESVHSLGDGYECHAFLGAFEALHYLQDTASVPDLIVIDINMPKMNGEQCIGEIGKIEKLRFVLLAVSSSSIPSKETLSILETSGVIFFQKPSSYDEMHRIFVDLISISSKRSKKAG